MKSLKTLWQKYKESTRRKKILIVFVSGLFILGSAALGFLVANNLYAANKAISPEGYLFNGKPREPRNFPNPINGILYTQSEADKWKNNLPLAVVIENHSDARPQSGLSKADVVYEALAEGGITRFLAVFLAEETTLGPVRSNRPYFLDWTKEYSAGYAHVGGSPKAQALRASYGIKDLDQFGLGFPTYERVGFRAAPHNVYTTTKKLKSAAKAKGFKGPVKIESWKFTDDEIDLKDRPKKFELRIPYPAFGMNVLWKYDRKSNTYLRFNGGVSHKDKQTGKQLFAKTIIVQFIPTSLEDSYGRLRMKSIGKGKVKIFRDGKVLSGTWKKDSRSGRTKFFDAKNKEIALNRGKIWASVVPSDYSLSIKKTPPPKGG